MAKKEAPATTQAEYDKAYEEVKSGKQPVPSFNDMGPLPTKKEADKNKDTMQKALLEGATKGMGGKELGKKLGMKKGGSVSSASSRADGCAVKGKTKGRIV